MSEESTIFCKLVATEEESLGYTTLVFETLEPAVFGKRFIMCVVYPNWQSRIPDLGEVGYLRFQECIAGDTWYNHESGELVPYKYTNIVFIKFIKQVDNSLKDIIL